jgi:hypothetical protein
VVDLDGQIRDRKPTRLPIDQSLAARIDYAVQMSALALAPFYGSHEQSPSHAKGQRKPLSFGSGAKESWQTDASLAARSFWLRGHLMAMEPSSGSTGANQNAFVLLDSLYVSWEEIRANLKCS